MCGLKAIILCEIIVFTLKKSKTMSFHATGLRSSSNARRYLNCFIGRLMSALSSVGGMNYYHKQTNKIFNKKLFITQWIIAGMI